MKEYENIITREDLDKVSECYPQMATLNGLPRYKKLKDNNLGLTDFHFGLLDAIVRNLVFRNITIHKQSYLSKVMGVPDYGLRGALESLGNCVKFEMFYDGFYDGTVKVLINPKMGFVYPIEGLYKERDLCFEEWIDLKFDNSETI